MQRNGAPRPAPPHRETEHCPPPTTALSAWLPYLPLCVPPVDRATVYQPHVEVNRLPEEPVEGQGETFLCGHTRAMTLSRTEGRECADCLSGSRSRRSTH